MGPPINSIWRDCVTKSGIEKPKWTARCSHVALWYAICPKLKWTIEWVPSQWIFIGSIGDAELRRMSRLGPIKQVARADFWLGRVFCVLFHSFLFVIPFDDRRTAIRLMQPWWWHLSPHISWSFFSADCLKGFGCLFFFARSLSDLPVVVVAVSVFVFVIDVVITHNRCLRNRIGMRE